jgi:hypothetical protein
LKRTTTIKDVPWQKSLEDLKGESVNDIEAVISQLERQRQAIDNALAALRDISGISGGASRTAGQSGPGAPRKRVLTPAGRRRIAEAARRRWAEKRAAEAGQLQAKAVKKAPRKSQISAAGRKRLAEAMRKRWALKRAAQGQSPAKKVAGKKSATKKAASKQAG